MKKRISLIMVLILSFLFLACGKDSKPVTIGQTFVIKAIEPTVGGTPWSLTTHGLSETVYTLDRNGNLVSRYVDKVEEIGDLKWKMELKKGVKFSDGTEVNAETLAWSLNTIMKENPLSHATGGVVKFEPTGDYEITLVSERRIKNLKAFLTEWTNIVFKKGEKGYVFTGPYVAKDLEPGVFLSLKPNKYYENADKRGEVLIKAFKDVSALKLAFESNDLDMAFGLTPEIAAELKKEGKIIEKIDAGYQYFAILNIPKAIRNALNLGLDRKDYIKALKGGRIANGLFAQYFPFAGDIDLEYNPEKARAILEGLGYKLNADNMYEKDGKVLEINLVTYNGRPDLKIIMQVMVSQMKDLGIKANTKIVENIDSYINKEPFDIVLYAQHTAPTGDPVYFLNQFFRTDGSKNLNNYSSKTVDTYLDEMAQVEEDEAVKVAHDIQRKLYTDLPMLFLVDPEWNIGLSERLKDYKPYSGDYYIVNSELFVK